MVSIKGVEVIDVTKKFGNVEALKHITMNIKQGEFFVILGPSGSGKSTLLRIIAGLESPDTGKIFINGRDVTSLEPKKRNIAMVFQNYALYPHMTVFDNMAFALRMRKYPRSVIRERVNETARILKIEHLLKRKPRELSGGEKQRVALGRAIVRNPEVFLFDEPLSNLDAKLRMEVRVELKNIHNSIGKTSIYVTHDQVEAMTLADRIAIIKDGELQQMGTPEEVYMKPSNTFVAGFIGFPSINFIEGYIRENYLYINNTKIKKIKIEEKKVIVGIRPEDIKITKTGILKGRIILKELLGGNVIYHLDFNGNVIRLLSSDINYREGDEIRFNFIREKIYIFNKDTGLKVN